MSHLAHIIKNKTNLELRAQIIRLVREFFWSQGFTEMETPIILRLPGQEPYLSPMKIDLHNEKGQTFKGYLHTSPEYTMKKMLAAGFTKIFSVCKVFRDNESFGGAHNPEFTMIEWYRAGVDFYAIMDDVERLSRFIQKGVPAQKDSSTSLPRVASVGMTKSDGAGSKFERLHMREAWEKYVGVNLDEYLERGKMFGLCISKGYKPNEKETFDDLFFRIFLNEIEPHLGKDGITILHHYPASMAALSKVSEEDPRYAERFEVYAGGMELANAFTELTDADEQLRRLKEEQEYRRKMGKDVFDIDMNFIEAVRQMPPAGGIALGIDRLVQIFASCKNIDDVIVLSASQLF